MVSNEDRFKVFENELKAIFDISIRKFTELCLVAAPDYFFCDCPASSSGKYHNLNELGPDGTIIHTRRVCRTAYDLCRGIGCEKHRDEILSACIIHDLLKQGKTKTGHTVKHHPKLAADLVAEVYEATQITTEASATMIRNCVGYHYGPWSIDPWKKELSFYTAEELCVYLSDYIASKRGIEVEALS